MSNPNLVPLSQVPAMLGVKLVDVHSAIVRGDLRAQFPDRTWDNGFVTSQALTAWKRR